MSELSPVANSADAQRAVLRSATQQLFQSWRGPLAAAFSRDTMEVLDRELSATQARLADADRALDHIRRRLRDLGCDA